MMTVENKGKSLKEIEEVISKAIKKVGAHKENDLCKYLPVDTGGYMHHFTMKKMKQKQPQQLGSLIEKFIIASDKPAAVAPKRRAPRGSRKRRDTLSLSKAHLEKMLQIARNAGEKEIVSVLSPIKSLPSIKRDLISSIRQGIVDQDLWNSYIDCVQTESMISNIK